MAIQDQIPKSRITLKYKTEVEGKEKMINLPMRFLVTGDFSQGSSKDRKVDLEERRLRSMDGKNTNDVMKDMGINLDMVVPNKIDPDKEDNFRVNVPISSMKSFSPDQVAQNVPKVKGLLLLKELLNEATSNVANKKEFRNLLSELYSNEEAFKKIMDELKGFEGFRLPEKKEGESGEGGDGEASAE